MSDTAHVRPMTAADYGEGHDVAPASTKAERQSVRELAVGAVVAAAALWAVPKVLDYLADAWGGGRLDGDGFEDGEDFEDDGLELER